MRFNDIDYLKRKLRISLLVFFSLCISSCNLTLAQSDYLQIVVKGENFTISWDDDSLRVANNLNKTIKYKLYIKPHGSFLWDFVSEIDSIDNPKFTFDQSLLDYGIYDIGVRSVNGSGRESAIHSSLDMTADPFCGWYVNWIGSK